MLKSCSARDSASIGEGIFQNGQVHLDIGGREVGGRLHFFFGFFSHVKILLIIIGGWSFFLGWCVLLDSGGTLRRADFSNFLEFGIC